MKRVLEAFAYLAGLLLLLALPSLLLAKDCKYTVHRHERRVTLSMRKAVFAHDGIAWEDHRAYVVDHVVPLELGGTNDLSNLKVQQKPEGKRKDRVENFLARCVCDGWTSLKKAQNAIHYWRKVGGTCP